MNLRYLSIPTMSLQQIKNMLMTSEKREEEILISEEGEVRAKFDENGGASVFRERKGRKVPGYLGNNQMRMPKGKLHCP